VRKEGIMKTINDFIGHWPPEIKNARREKRLLVITPEKALKVIHGKTQKNKLTFFVSNERVHIGILTLNKGRFTDPEVHKGDEALWAIKGNVQIKIFKEGEGEKAVFTEVQMIRENQKFLIPEGYKHQYFNLSAGTSKILFAIAPCL
jgi:mannose-6-phosphate isomerase-like protein (cupin superfamily)